MSIATRIEAIEQHLTDDYSVLELAGADLTNVDKNIFNLKQSWEERLLYFLANGTDTLWNNWEKVSGSGTTLSLNNTIEAKMGFVYKGNTYQETTTGKNLFNYLTPNIKQITWTPTDNGGFFTSSTFWKNLGNKLELDTTKQYTFSFGARNSDKLYYYIKTYTDETYQTVKTTIVNDGTALSKTFTPDSKYVSIYFANGANLRHIEIPNIQLEEGNTVTSFEKYTGGIPSPNPDYPQEIQVVSGDNEIVVCGKNLFDKSNTNVINGFINASSVIKSSSNDRIIYIPCKANTTYSVQKMLQVTTSKNRFSLGTTEAIPTLETIVSQCYKAGDGTTTTSYTITTKNTSKYLVFFCYSNDTETTFNEMLNSIQIEISDEPTTYEAYKGENYPINIGNIELCKIENYKDSIKKSTGKNLFGNDDFKIELGTISATGYFGYSTERVRAYWVEVKENTTYHITTSNSDLQIVPYYYNSSKTFISFDSGWKNFPFTFTTPANTKYIAFLFKNSTNNPTPSSLTEIMLNEGTTATPYEPYGKVWYLNKQIGKVVLDGSESWIYDSSRTRFLATIYSTATMVRGQGLCNYYRYGDSVNSGCFDINVDKRTIYMFTPDSSITTISAFKTWLSTHNTTVYYVLATPTTTEITDTTLISQLETIKKSYNSQTNISQTNDDMPFELDVVALGELEI